MNEVQKSLNGWRVTNRRGFDEVYPLDDLKEHEGEECWCQPVWDDDVLVHNSLDRREEYERGRLKS